MRSQPPALAKLALALVACSALAWSGSPEPRLSAPSDTRADFSLRHGDVTSRLRIQTASLLPGETLDLSALDRTGGLLAIQVADAPGLERRGRNHLRFRAGQRPGLTKLEIRPLGAREAIDLNVFVEVPRTRVRGAALNGYAIGRYPTSDPNMAPPPGFIEVTAANRDTKVSPHFRLGDFVCKESGGYPKYLVLDPRLPAKLEALLERARAAGLHANTFTVMSGYRTPAYHRAIGNTTGFSRHLWGMGADVFIDADGDGKMDDLNGDGVVDQRDAQVLFALADALDRAPSEDWTVGGASAYRATDAHGPFVHVDVRGRAARW